MSQSNDFPECWPRVWRGESSGILFEQFDLAKTNARCGFFFAQDHEHAQGYAGRGTTPRPFVLDVGKVLDLRDPYGAWIKNPEARQVIQDLRDDYDEWVDPTSGEPMEPCDFMEAGDLYNYDLGQRWNRLFVLASLHGYDSVVIHDATDGCGSGLGTTWVVFDPSRIHPDPARPQPKPDQGGARPRMR